jgi:hypothetical protein
VWQVSIAELIGSVVLQDPEWVISHYDLNKYTLEVTWSGAYYSWWLGWGRVRPLIGWQKEKCWSRFDKLAWGVDYPSFAISEAEMQLFPSRLPFRLPVD